MAEKEAPAPEASADDDTSQPDNVKGLMLDFAENTSMHGLGRVVSSRFLWLRLVWAALVMAGAGIALYNLITIVTVFLSYPVSTVVSLEYDSHIDFPAVTICNLNLLRKSQYEQSTHLQQFRDEEAAEEVTTQAAPSAVTGFNYDYDEFDAEKSQEEAEKIQEFLSNISPDVQKTLGHQLQDMLIQCGYQGIECTHMNFTHSYNKKYGNCYTFNKEEEAIDVSKSGPTYGLKFLLNVEEDEYMQLTETVGFKIVIHPPDEMPFPDDDVVMVGPGFTSVVAVSKIEIHRTEEPYGKCVNYGSEGHNYINMYAEANDVGYSDKACYRTCLQTNMFLRCGCCIRDYPCQLSSRNGSIVDADFCNKTDIFTIFCEQEVSELYQADLLGCTDTCLPSCRQTSYSTEVSSGRWPSKARENITLAFFAKHDAFQTKEVTVDYLEDNIAKVFIYFKQLNFEKIETTPAYDWSRLLGDLGGQFGLWLGFSLLTAVEIVQLLFDLCLHVGRRVTGRRARTSPQGSQDL